MTATPPTYFPGVSIYVVASDFAHRVSGPITSGATVTFVIVDLDGVEQDGLGGTATATNDDWGIEFDTPASSGQYKALATAVYDGSTWKGEWFFNVQAHQ